MNIKSKYRVLASSALKHSYLALKLCLRRGSLSLSPRSMIALGLLVLLGTRLAVCWCLLLLLRARWLMGRGALVSVVPAV